MQENLAELQPEIENVNFDENIRECLFIFELLTKQISLQEFNVTIFFQKKFPKNSSKFVDILAKQSRSPFNLTYFFTETIPKF